MFTSSVEIKTKKLRNAAKTILLFVAVIIQSGCSFIPHYERPAPPTACSYPRESGSQASIDTSQLAWEDFFTDPSLQELICLALDNNRDLRMAMERIEEARALYDIRRSDQFPTLNAFAPGLRLRIPASLSPFGSPILFSFYQAALSLSTWELDFWGRVRSLKEAALESYLATEEAKRSVAISLIGEVANTYLMRCELNELIAIAEKTIKSRQESYRIAKRRYEEGSSSKLDAVQAESLLNQARADWTVLKRTVEINWNAMTLLVGNPVIAFDQPLSKIEPYFTQEISEGLPSDLLCNRPDILAAEHKLKAANANIGAARAAFFPTIALTGSYGTASNELEGLFDSGSQLWAFAPTISLPIFDGGRNVATLDLSEARQNLAITEYEHTIQIAFREVADALAERHWYTEQVAEQTATLAAQSERTRLAWLRYKNGASPYLEVLDAERDRFVAEQTLVQTRRASLASNVKLYTALGGGSCR